MSPRTEAGRYGFATRQIHAGASPEGPHRPRATPIHLTAGFTFESFDQAHHAFAGTSDDYSYTRVGNPTITAAEQRIAALEGGIGALLVGSGQAATTTALLAVASAGDHVVSASSVYEGTRELLRDNLARLGIDVTFVYDADDMAEWQAAVGPRTRAFFAESLSNPRNEVLDIRAVADVAHRSGVPLIIDNTLATPYLVRPIEHGADLVVHSASKFLAGHGTVLGGVLVDGGWFDWATEPGRYPHLAETRGADGRTAVERYGASALVDYARTAVAMRFGPVASPFNAFFILQGIETLSLRVQRHSDSADRIARWLAEQPAVASVDYSGLPGSPYRAVADRYLPDGRGSVFSFTLRGGRAAASAVVDALALFTRMTHLGDVRSLVLHPASTTHVNRAADDLARSGIGPGLLRLSIGLEDPDDLIGDLARAFEAIPATDAAPAAPADPVTEHPSGHASVEEAAA